MSTFDLKVLEDFFMKMVVKKFDAAVGVKFYRSSKEAKKIVDWVSPRWTVSNTELIYHSTHKSFHRSVTDEHGVNYRREFIDCPEKSQFGLTRIETVIVCTCEAAFFKNVVLSDLKAMGGVGLLSLFGEMPEDNVKLLVETAKPEAVGFFDLYYDGTSPIFQNVKGLFINVHMVNAESYWKTNKIFELGRNRTNITLDCNRLYDEMVATILETWIKGESTGSLEKLTLRMRDSRWHKCSVSEEVETLLTRLVSETTSKDLLKSYLKTGENDRIFERGASGRLCFHVDNNANRIDFYFC